MSITVIKHGEKTFKITCPICGCEFEYTCEDIEMNYVNYNEVAQVKCPDCSQYVNHVVPKQLIYTIPQTLPPMPCPDVEPIINPITKWNQPSLDIDWCDGCPNRYGPRDGLGNPIAGDSPCQWCPHSPLKVTCTTSNTEEPEKVNYTINKTESKVKNTTSTTPDFAKYLKDNK